MSFVIGSYRALDQPGDRRRASVVEHWRGEDLRSTDEVGLTVLPLEVADHARDTVIRLQIVDHPHLLPVTEVLKDGERVALVSPWPRGGRLRELLDRRGRLTPAETLTVLIPVASVLAAVEAAGLRHAGLCAESVWFDELGRPQVGSLAASRLSADLNDGLPDRSRDVAPEVVRGERAGGPPVTAAADVFSLGSLALQCLTGRPAWPADDPADVLVQSAAGQWPDLPDDAGPALLVDLVRAMLAAQPDRRPTAATVVDELAEVASPAPIRFGSGATPVPVSTDRWRGWESSRRSSASSTGRAADEPAADIPERDRPEQNRPDSDRSEPDRSEPDRSEPDRSEPDRSEPDRSEPDRSEPDRSEPGRPEPDRWGRGRSARRGRRQAAAGRTSVRRAPSDPDPDRDQQPVNRRNSLARSEDDGALRRAGRPRSARAEDVGAGEQEAGRTPLARAGIVVLCGLLVTLVVIQLGVWLTGGEDPGSTPSEQDAVAVSAGPAGDPDWSVVVGELDAARARALAAADPSLLAQVYVADSAAGRADMATISGLADRGWRVRDGVHVISSVTVEPAGGAGNDPGSAGGAIQLSVVDSLPAHPVVDAAGKQVGLTPARPEQRRIMVVQRTGDGYRISDITGPG